MVCNFVYYLKLYHNVNLKLIVHSQKKNVILPKNGGKFVFMCDYGALFFFLFRTLNQRKTKSHLTNVYAIVLRKYF